MMIQRQRRQTVKERERQREVDRGRVCVSGAGGSVLGALVVFPHCRGGAWSLRPPVPCPWFPPYHLCLSHLKGRLLPLLTLPFVLLTNVAALEGEKQKLLIEENRKEKNKM